jgi:CheY-like chemotaxis protein
MNFKGKVTSTTPADASKSLIFSTTDPLVQVQPNVVAMQGLRVLRCERIIVAVKDLHMVTSGVAPQEVASTRVPPVLDPPLPQHKDMDILVTLGTLAVIDDNNLNRKVMERIARNFGFKKTMTFNDGSDFFKAIEDGQVDPKMVDVILMDLMMPKMDGFETTRKIRELLPDSVDKPYIIAVTAASGADAKVRAKEMGVNDFINKGSPSTLTDALRKAVLRESSS